MTDTKYILAGRLIDGSGGEIQKYVWLKIAGGKIAAIIKRDEFTPPQDGEIVDLSHCTLLPPLVDCSVKLSFSAATSEQTRKEVASAGYSERKSIMKQNMHYLHSHGVLGIADCSGADQYVGRFIGEESESVSIEIKTSASDCQNKPDFLHVKYSRDIREFATPESTPDTIAKDHAPGLIKAGSEKIVVRANGEKEVADALQPGCGAIEQGYGMGEENLQYMAKQNIVWIPCMLEAKVAAEQHSGEKKVLFQKILKEQLGQVRRANELGVRLAMGTGSGNSGVIHGDSAVEEIKLFQQAGLSLVEALQVSSSHGAELLEMNDLGLLMEGKTANFLVSRGMVQQLPRKLSYLEDIYIAGNPSNAYRKNPVKTVYKR